MQKYPILIVDDEPAIVDGLTYLLRADGMEAAGASDRASARDLLGETFYPVIVTDLCLHTIEDGMGLLADIQRLSPTSRVVAISAYATPEVEAKVLSEGAVALLPKPFEGQELIDLVLEIVQELEREDEESGGDLEVVYAAARNLLHSIPQRQFGLSAQDAEDVVQQAWLLFLQKRSGIRSTRPWLAATVANLCRQHRDKRRFAWLDDEEAQELPDNDDSVIDDVLAVRQALERVDDRSRALCSMIAMEGHSYQEVSDMLGWPLGSVGPMFLRAKARVKKALNH